MHIYTATSTTHELRKVWRMGKDGPEQDESAEGYRYAKDFIYERHDLRDLDDLCALLNRLADVPTASLVMGRPLIERGSRTGLDFEDELTTLCGSDLDSLEFDGTPQEAIEFAYPFLRGRKYVYAFSPSAGFKPGHRLRVFFESELMTQVMFQVHAEQWGTDLALRVGVNRAFIDGGVHKAGGFLFTSRPKLIGLEDPHPLRAFVVEGKSGPVVLAPLPKMIDVEVGAAAQLGQTPTLRWDPTARHKSVFAFMVAYRTSFPSSTYTECWEALSEQYDALGVSARDQHEFGMFYVKARYGALRGASGSRKAFATERNELPLDEAEALLKREIGDFVSAREPGVKVIAGEVGGGKTSRALYWLGVETRYAASVNSMFYTDLYVPNHNLSAQIEADARAQGMTAYTEFGRSQEVGGVPVCQKHEAISKVSGIIKETRKAFCENEDSVCEFRHGCPWWAQHDKSMTHDLRIRTHAHLPLQIAKDARNNRTPDFVVIDENFIAALIKQSYVEIKDLCDVTRHDLGEWLLKFAHVVKAGLTLDALEAAGFTVDVCRALIKAEEALCPVVEITPSMSAADALKAADGFDVRWYLYAGAWRRVRDCLSSRSMNRLRVSPNKKGLFLNWRQKIAGIPWDNETNRPKVPILILSATIKRSMIEAVLPVDDYVTIEIEKHKDAKVSQIVVNASKSALLYGTGERGEEYEEKDKRKIADAKAFRDDVAQISEGRYLFSYKALADEKVELAGWFNAVEGLNTWAGGRIDVVGRPLPAPTDVEDIAAAIHQDGAPILRAGLWYPKKPIALVGGKGMSWCERHPDARVEDVRWTICEGAMMQAVGRARHVRKGCEIRLFTNMVLPIRVDEVLNFADLRPAEVEYQQAPVRVASPALAKRLFSKFATMSVNGIKGSVGDVYTWAMENRAEFVEVRLQGEKQWSRVWLAEGGWRWLCDRVAVVDWRDASRRADDRQERFDALVEQTEHVREVNALREAFEREAWCDEDGAVVDGAIMTGAGFMVEMADMPVVVRDAGSGAGSGLFY